jgi:hypothetical protein
MIETKKRPLSVKGLAAVCFATADIKRGFPTVATFVNYVLLLLLLLVVVVVVVVVVVFSPWAILGRSQSPFRRPVWLWSAAFWASS